MSKNKIIISGGGTGGHIFPAISIANALKNIDSNFEILFVGAEGKMEMEKVPAAGYKIVGLPIRGLQRNFSLENLKFFFRLFNSLFKARKIIKDFKPNIAVGVGGYASGPLLFMANRNNIPTLIQEQNSYAGLTNKLLAKNANKICVAYENMDKFFPKEKIILTGNPIRKDLKEIAHHRQEAYTYFNLDKNKRTILVLGGSLGARTINNSIIAFAEQLINSEIQIIWQTGKNYISKAQESLKSFKNDNIIITDFISRMDLAYSAADIVISRAGAGTISELCLVQKACILVPSPNVSEDHQTKNALALVNKQAAIMIIDSESVEKLIPRALKLISDEAEIINLTTNIAKLAKPSAADDIAMHIISLIKK